MKRPLERASLAFVVLTGIILLTIGYLSPERPIKLLGGIILVFVWYVAYDIVVNRD